MGGKSKNRLLFGKKVALTRGKQAKRRASRGRGEGKLLLEKLESSRGCGETASLGTAGGLSQRRCHTQQKQTSKKKENRSKYEKRSSVARFWGPPKVRRFQIGKFRASFLRVMFGFGTIFVSSAEHVRWLLGVSLFDRRAGQLPLLFGRAARRLTHAQKGKTGVTGSPHRGC